MTNIFKYCIIQFIISIISWYKGCEVVLEKKAFDIICQLLEEFFKKYDYKMVKKDTADSEVWQAVFVGKDKAYSVNWISSEKKYKLNIASVSDGVYDDFNNISRGICEKLQNWTCWSDAQLLSKFKSTFKTYKKSRNC